MKRVLADTSFWFSLAVRSDVNHQRTKALAAQLQDEGALLHVSQMVIAETHRLILHKLGIGAGHQFIAQLFLQIEKGFVRLLPVGWDEIGEAKELLFKYCDQDITLTDACSAVLMRRHGIESVASYDGHFVSRGICPPLNVVTARLSCGV